MTLDDLYGQALSAAMLAERRGEKALADCLLDLAQQLRQHGAERAEDVAKLRDLIRQSVSEQSSPH